MEIKETEYANSVFEQPWWLDIVAEGRWQETLVEEDNKVLGRMVFVKRGNKIVMPPFTQTLGPWLDQSILDKAKGNAQLAKQKEVINKLFEPISDRKSIDLVLNSNNQYILPYRWLGFSYTPLFSYRINNLENLDDLYLYFSKSIKNNIKTAQKKVSVYVGSDSDAIVDLLEKTFAAQGRKAPGDKAVKKKIIDKACELQRGVTLIAKDVDGNIHSGAFLLFDRQICYYLFGGTDYNYKGSCAQSLVLWEAIKYAANVSKVFDFEGSNVEGIENLFRQYNSVSVTNYRITKNTLCDDLKEILKPRVKRILGFKI